MDQAVAYHLVLSLEAPSHFGSSAALDGTIMWSDLGVDIGMGAKTVSHIL